MGAIVAIADPLGRGYAHVAAEEEGAGGACFRVHHLASPFPLLAADGEDVQPDCSPLPGLSPEEGRKSGKREEEALLFDLSSN